MTHVRTMIADLAARARTELDPTALDYFAGGSGAEVSLGEAAAAWSAYRLRPRVLVDVSTVDITTSLLGTGVASPVALAPMAYQGLLHTDGEVAVRRGAGAHLSIVSTRATCGIDDIGAAAPGPWWFQVYLTVDRRVVAALVERAVAAGAGALVLTGDTPYIARKARGGRPIEVAPAADQDPAATLADIAWLREISGLPVLVKGVLRGDDARRCLDAGADGLVVSNHGGRQLDRAVAPARALPEVVAAAGAAPVLVDGGITSGLDVLTALALGARGVLVGRPFAWALATGGADGVADLLAAFDDEFAHVLGLAGCPDIAAATRDLVAD